MPTIKKINNGLNTTQSLTIPDVCYQTAFLLDQYAIRQSSPTIILTINGQSINILNCAYSWTFTGEPGIYEGKASSATLSYTRSCGTLTQNVRIDDVVPDTVSGEIEKRYIYFQYPPEDWIYAGSMVTYKKVTYGPQIFNIENTWADSGTVVITDRYKPVISISASSPDAVGSLEYYPFQSFATASIIDTVKGEFIIPDLPETEQYIFYLDNDIKNIVEVYIKVFGLDACGTTGERWTSVRLKYEKDVKKIQIVNHEPREIWPYLPPQNNDKKSRGADRPGYNPKRSFEIRVTDAANYPLKNEKVTIFAKYQIGTGGHGHKGFANDSGTIKADTILPTKLQGTFYRGTNNSGKNSKDTLQLTTDSNGIAKVDSFRASEASGKYLITAWLTSDSTNADTVNMQVKVPDFVEFADGTYWNLTGTASNRGKNHLSNHWCTQKMKDSLEAAIQEFYEWTLTEDGGKSAVELGINDMCLNWGGAFDFPGQWKFGSAHSFHRVGLSVDIDNAGLKKTDPNNSKKKILTDRGLKLQKIMKTYGGYIYDENEIHFGFNNGN